MKIYDPGLVAAHAGIDSGHLKIAWPVSRATTATVALVWAYRCASQGIIRSLQALQQAEHHALVCIRSCEFFAWHYFVPAESFEQ
eukprot:6173533-Pleurochrysis_carterae.AAC.4